MKLAPLAALALAAPLAAQAPGPTRPQRVDIAMTHDGFVPRQISLRGGAPYVLRLTNRTGTGHNLNQPAFFRDAALAPADRPLAGDGTISLRPGERVAVRLRAPLNRPGATYQFSSTVLADAAGDWKGVFVIR